MKAPLVAKLMRQNLREAKHRYPTLRPRDLKSLGDLTRTLRVSVPQGEVLFIHGKWYVTHGGLLRIARRHRCWGIRTLLQERQSDPTASRWVFKAIVYESPGSAGFSGYGDADPTNTSPLVRGAEMRVAETRAVNRALRKAYGIAVCSVEELSWFTDSPNPVKEQKLPAKPHSHSLNGSNNGQPKLRDRLRVLIRQHNLDPILVKAFAADFCGTPTLKDASRDKVESFISHLATTAKEDRDGLVCKLNSYAQPVEVTL